MGVLIKNARLADGQLASVVIRNGSFGEVQPQGSIREPEAGDWSLDHYALESSRAPIGDQLIRVDAANALLVPAGIDVHVHSREPGYPAKEDWQSLAQAAYRGGVVGVVDMPNTLPATLGRAEVEAKAQLAEASGIDFRLLLGVNTANIATLADLLTDQHLPLAGLKVYYGQSTGNLMYADLDRLAQALPSEEGGMLVFHSEDQCRIDAHHERLLGPDQAPGRGAKTGRDYSVHSQIRDSASAWQATATILAWGQRWQRPLHIAHVSTPREMEMILAARAAGATITCEVAPHHLLLSQADYPRLEGFLKVNPPVRSPDEVHSLRGFMASGAIDCFATDHAPHGREEKLQPYDFCPSGMPALEFFWPLFYTCVQSSGASLAKSVRMVGAKPGKLFRFPRLGEITAGYRASFVWLKEQTQRVGPAQVTAKCGWSPYEGMALNAQVMATWHDGRCMYSSMM